MSGTTQQHGERRAAVLIAAHNEEPVIEATLESVLVSYPAADIYVFDDASTDRTAALAREYLPASNVLTQTTNVGKSRGLEYALREAIFPADYEFVSIVDADTTMEPAFRRESLAAMEDERVICVAGHVKSRPDGMASVYRAWLYFVWQTFFKRVQSALNAVSIAPGCGSTWRTSALRQIRFDHRMSTEDFHLSIAAHRLRLGLIRYVPGAVVWTQDPPTVRSFLHQTFRWSRAWWEVVRYHRLGLRWFYRDIAGRWHFSAVDVFSALLVVSMILFFMRMIVLAVLIVFPVPVEVAGIPGDRASASVDLARQLVVFAALIAIAALGTKRPVIAVLAPIVLVFMLLDFAMSMRALASVARSTFPRPRATLSGQAGLGWTSPERTRVAPVRGGQGTISPRDSVTGT